MQITWAGKPDQGRSELREVRRRKNLRWIVLEMLRSRAPKTPMTAFKSIDAAGGRTSNCRNHMELPERVMWKRRMGNKNYYYYGNYYYRSYFGCCVWTLTLAWNAGPGLFFLFFLFFAVTGP